MTRSLPVCSAIISHEQGGLFTFSGIEGAGKSTLVQQWVKALEAHGEQPIVIWSRPGYTPALNVLKRILRRARKSKNSAPRSYPVRAGSFQSTFIRRIWLVASLIDLLWVYGIQMRWHLAQGRVIVCDRYLPDARIDMISNFAQDRVESWLLWRLLEWFAPQATQAFLMLIPLEVSLQRCAERGGCIDNAEQVFAQRLAHYLPLASSKSIVVLDGCKPLNENLAVVQSLITSNESE